MKKHAPVDPPDVQITKRSRRTRLQALLFSSAALGTTLAMIGVLDIPKKPTGSGE